MEKFPLVSIITPSYNQGGFLEQTIRSVLQQTYSRIEYLLIDGGSSDESKQILQKYARHFSYWVSEPDRGQAHAINKGLARAKGEIVGWINADDLLLPETVATAVSAFLENPGIDVVYGGLQRIDAHGKLVPTPVLPKDRIEFSKEQVIGECIVNQPGSFWQSKWVNQVGFLDENLRYGLDYEYWIRIALAGGEFKRLPQAVAQFRLSEGSKTVGETEKMGLEQLKILNDVLAIKALGSKIGLSPEQIKRRARQTRSAISLHIFYGYLKKKNLQASAHWLAQAVKYDPLIFFQRRWFDLAWARITRQKAVSGPPER
jgi:glycosyltransferase involved in cell wall biosynthesis